MYLSRIYTSAACEKMVLHSTVMTDNSNKKVFTYRNPTPQSRYNQQSSSISIEQFSLSTGEKYALDQLVHVRVYPAAIHAFFAILVPWFRVTSKVSLHKCIYYEGRKLHSDVM